MADKKDKLAALKLDTSVSIPDDYVDILYKYIIIDKSQIKTKNTQPQVKTIDTTSDKYIVLLKFLNNIMDKLNRPHITHITEFANINRDDIIREDVGIMFNKMHKELFKHFDKVKCGWYRRNLTNTYILTFLRYACDELNIDFTYKKKEKSQWIGNTSFKKAYIVYSINLK
jgi:hypothetical protein